MKTFSAKQFTNVPAWQAKAATKQAKKQAKQFKRDRNSKRVQWEQAE